ncbi:hypothetical protein FQA39_LY12823 [Lamprigera yunnana]|nr:hypothetical protein FQA39_LY12823 [Lamprigera yunnana]
MTDRETAAMTKAYVESGKVYDVSKVKGFKADKHSTGGVGDKTSLVFSPLVASYGIKVCKLSGRGLGQTGGTIDKLESFPVGMSLIAQSNEIVPADKKIYALRDVTGTVDSMPLIAASIICKNGFRSIHETVEQATDLAQRMIGIGRQYNRKIAVMITDMDKPLAEALGLLSMNLGGWCATKEESIDHAAGIYLNKAYGDEVNVGDVVMTLSTNKAIDAN